MSLGFRSTHSALNCTSSTKVGDIEINLKIGVSLGRILIHQCAHEFFSSFLVENPRSQFAVIGDRVIRRSKQSNL